MAQELQISDFDYELPSELIAQEPCVQREDARLLVVHRDTQQLSHHHVYDLPKLLQPDDLLVFNNTKVLPARIYGIRRNTGGKWEGLYLRELQHLGKNCWELMAQTRGYIQEGEWIDLLDRTLQESPYHLQVTGRTPDLHLLVTINPSVTPVELLNHIGHMPLPPYIRKGLDRESDRDRYQTVYANNSGSIAAPTAGLHFTPELLTRLSQQRIEQAFVTLHVGVGTFAPVKVENLDEHVMHEEWCQLPVETADTINNKQGRCIAVGTTTLRTLESAAPNQQHKTLSAWSGSTRLFIRPGFQFKVIDGLMTNFHLPRSTLLILISALAGRELIMKAYAEAIQHRYRFFSYGDAMLIL